MLSNYFVYVYIYIYVCMESTKHNTEDLLVDSLSFKLPGSGQYVVDRRSCPFHTECSNGYSASNGTIVLKFKLNGENLARPCYS